MEKILPFWIIVAPIVWALADYMMSSKTTSMAGGQHSTHGLRK